MGNQKQKDGAETPIEQAQNDVANGIGGQIVTAMETANKEKVKNLSWGEKQVYQHPFRTGIVATAIGCGGVYTGVRVGQMVAEAMNKETSDQLEAALHAPGIRIRGIR